MASILDLPDVVLLKILSLMPVWDQCILAATCHQIKTIVEKNFPTLGIVVSNGCLEGLYSATYGRTLHTCVGLSGLSLPSSWMSFVRQARNVLAQHLQELVLHDCRVPKETLILNNIPRSVRTFRISAVKVLDGNDHLKNVSGWFPKLIRDLEQRRRNYGSFGPDFFQKYCLSNLEWRTHGLTRVDYSEFAKSVHYMSSPLSLATRTYHGMQSETTSIFYWSKHDDLSGKIAAITRPTCQTIVPLRVTGLSWNLDSEGFSNLIIIRTKSQDPSLLVLNDHVLLLILEMLDPLDLCVMAVTCKRIRNLAMHASLPRLIFENTSEWSEPGNIRLAKESVALVGHITSQNLFLNLSKQRLYLVNLAMHDCKVHKSHLHLKNFPNTLKVLKLSSIEVLDAKSKSQWLELFIRDMEEQRRTPQALWRAKIKKFQFRISYYEAMSDATCLRALESISTPFRMASKVGSGEAVISTSGPGDNGLMYRNLDTNSRFRRMLEPVYKNRQIADQKLDGILWELDENDVTTFTVTINDNWSSAGTNWT